MTSNLNPLLNNFDIPRFDQIEARHVEPAVTALIERCHKNLATLETQGKPTWDDLMAPLEMMGREIHAVWNPVSHLHSVKDTPELRDAYEKAQDQIVELGLRISQSLPLFHGYKAIQESPAWSSLSRAQQRVVEKSVLDSRLSGIELKGKDKDRYSEIVKELSKLSTQFSNNVLDATKAFHLDIRNADDVAGMPLSFKAVAAQNYNMKKGPDDPEATAERGPWRVTLDYPSYVPFMEHCPNRELRQTVYMAFQTRASSGNYDNSPLISRILKLRQEKSRLLGFTSYAEYSLAQKMAPDVDAVDRLSEELRAASFEVSKKELKDLQAYAAKKGFAGELAHWDISYFAEKMRQELYSYSEDEVRPYFPLPKVLQGLFNLVEKIFGIVVKEATGEVPSWHPDVKFFRVFDKSGTAMASFFLDPYSRPENKRGGAWMDNAVDRGYVNGKLQLPVVYLVCNGTPPVGNQPSLMSFREVETLFHEFGHGLHHMLSTVDVASVTGVNGVEWDAVELPSQFMENWCYHKPTLMGLTAHVETGKPLPEELFQKIAAAKNYRAASMMGRQLLFSMVDMELHHRFNPESGADGVFDVHRRIASSTIPLPPHPNDRFLCSFSHIFAGGYAAGYYSYKWAEVLSADAFSAFEEAGLDAPQNVAEVGQRFRNTVLAMGGSEHPMAIFKRFRGREPSTKALLRHSGLAS